jgi:hypothetical protein
MNKEKIELLKEIALFIKAKVITVSPPRISDRNTTWFTNYVSKAEKIP